MITKECSTHQVKIYIAGPIEVAKQILREECQKEGLCVTIEPTTFIYTQGEELGYVVGFINYPRFPKQPEDIYTRAKNIGIDLMHKTFQGSFTLVATDKTEFISVRAVDKV
jgi:hypothetical protein